MCTPHLHISGASRRGGFEVNNLCSFGGGLRRRVAFGRHKFQRLCAPRVCVCVLCVRTSTIDITHTTFIIIPPDLLPPPLSLPKYIRFAFIIAQSSQSSFVCVCVCASQTIYFIAEEKSKTTNHSRFAFAFYLSARIGFIVCDCDIALADWRPKSRCCRSSRDPLPDARTAKSPPRCVHGVSNVE